jgi:uncharacterized protein YndB with AHSA1/START domain
MTDPLLPYSLERRIVIRARRETVFSFFTDPRRWESWWGAGSRIDPEPGGEVRIRYPDGSEAAGRVLAIEPPARLVFSFGYASGRPVAPGGSRVTIELAETAEGTRLELRHELPDAAVRDEHVQGWRYQLALFANRVAEVAQAGVEERVDAWFALWSEPDTARRGELLAATVAPGIRFRDRWSAVDGAGDLAPHLDAVHRFLPGSRLERVGPVRHCQGTALADWRATRGGAPLGAGTNVFTLDADGRIEEVVGLWSG